MIRFVTVFSAFAILAGASAQRTRVPVGVDVGVFFPSSSEVRDAFGDTWLRVGITPLSFQRPENWKFTFDFAYLRRREGGNSATLIPVTFGVTKSFGTNPDMRPYVAFRGGPYYGDVTAPGLGVDTNRFGFDVNAAVGITFNQAFYIEARYDFFSDFDGLDFSGLFLSAGFKLFELRL